MGGLADEEILVKLKSAIRVLQNRGGVEGARSNSVVITGLVPVNPIA
jgi:hypothetical protein